MKRGWFLRLLHARRLWLLLAAAAGLAALRATGADHLVSFDTLRLHRGTLTAWVQAHMLLAAAGYFALYVVFAAAIPGSLLLTAMGGFLFGAWLGGALTVAAATIGATLTFLFARALFGPAVLARLGPRAQLLAGEMRRNSWSYLLALRLTPIFPFFFVNLVPACVGVRLGVFIATTCLGIVPGTAVFSLFGAGLGSVLDSGGTPDLSAALTPNILAALSGLAALSLAGIPIRAYLGRRAARSPGAAVLTHPDSHTKEGLV